MPSEPTPTPTTPPAETAGTATPATPATPTSVRIMRNVDIPLLALALGIFAVTGLPLLGWVCGAGAWAVQRIIGELAIRRADKSDDPRTKVGLLAGSMIARGWIVSGIIIAIGLGNNDAGLSGAVLFLLVFTMHLTLTMAMRPFEQPTKSAKKAPKSR
jgi:hypothetical protein